MSSGLIDRPAVEAASTAWRTAKRPYLSGLVTTYNSESHLRQCLDSIVWCDDVLVLDSFSTDATIEIARSYSNVRLLQRPYYGGASAKNWAVNQLPPGFVFILDSDEVCPPDLRDEIQSVLMRRPDSDAYFMRRRVFFLGKPIRFSGWQHDRVGRLYRVGTARFERRRVHADLVTDRPPAMLRHTIDHYMADSFDEYVGRTIKYSKWGAAQAYRDKHPAGLYQLCIRPLYRFIRTYFLQLGVLDGIRGLAFCSLQATGSFVKWATLWGWRLQEARGVPPDLPDFDDDETVWEGLSR